MYVELDGARIFFDVVGAQLRPDGDRMEPRPTLLLLHGGPGYDHSTLRPHFDQYADAFQVVYMDHRGCGRSSGARDGWTLDQWADDVHAFCQKLGIEHPVVLGQSFGGMVAMHYAARYPDAPAKLILSSTAARFLIDETARMTGALGGPEAARVARTFFTTPSAAAYAEYAKICLPLYTQTGPDTGADFRNRAIFRPEVMTHFFETEMKDMDLREEIAAIRCPVLVLAGALDPVTPVLCAREIAEAVGANARLEVFEACGHGVHRDNPEQSTVVMRDFLGV